MAKIELIHGDCMEGMKRYPDKYFELAIVDPPYGTEGDIERTGGPWSTKYQRDKTIKNWDFIPDRLYFDEIFRVSRNQIIWGGNYFTEYLKNNRCFVIWEKETISETFSMSMCEYAWSSFNENSKLFKYRPQDSGRIHPTQKPVKLYEWLLKNYAKSGDKILDTHLGSGSIAIACYNLDFSIVGFEIDIDYYNGAVNRLEEHKKQQRLFDTNRRDL